MKLTPTCIEETFVGRKWLLEDLEAVRSEVVEVVPKAAGKPGGQARLADYLVVLWWSARLVREHRKPLMAAFTAYVETYARDARPPPPGFRTYEAVALEWMLLGLAQTPPPGVTPS